MKTKIYCWSIIIIIVFSTITLLSGWSGVSSFLSSRLFGIGEAPANELVVWQTFGGTYKENLEKAVRGFEAAHPGIKVRLVFTPNDTSNSQKFFTAIAAGKAPDVTFVDGPQVAEWAEQGALQPLDAFMAKDGITSDDYFPPCWKQCNYNGHTWAATLCADPNFAFAWNKESFRKAGLDPNKPPATIEELDRISDRLTRRDSSGLKSMAIIPWNQAGLANSLYTWGWAFGGSFYDEEHRKITANDPKIVRALTWMCSYAKKYDVTKVSSMQQGFGTLDKDPFCIGQVAMTCYMMGSVKDARTYAPNLDYGLGLVPGPAGGETGSSWLGGWCLALPKGCKHPDLGWEFIRWMCADPKGTATVGRSMAILPGYRKSPYFTEVQANSKYAKFIEIMKLCSHQRPVMPAQAYYTGALDRAVSAALYGLKTPKQALDDATVETQRELDLKLSGR